MSTPTLLPSSLTGPHTKADVASTRYKYSQCRYVSIVIASFMINFTACGLLFAFGVYQAVYEALALQDDTAFTGSSSAEIDLIGTLSISLMTIGAPFTVAWVKQFPPRWVVIAGGLVFGLSNVLASFGTSLWHFQITQGLLLGIGTCLTFMPSMIVAPMWFEENRALAVGIISAGTGIGGLVWAPVVTVCVARMGFRNTLRFTGALAAGLLCAAGGALSWEPSVYLSIHEGQSVLQGVRRFFQIPLPNRETARQRKFWAQVLSAGFQSAAYYTPTFFTVLYAKNLGYDATTGANLTAVSNACNAIGKISMGLLADKIGRVNAFWLTTLLSTSATLGLWVCSTVIGNDDLRLAKNLFIGFMVMFGIFASAFISLFTPVLVEVFGVQELPRLSGVLYLTQGIAALIGTPVAGVLLGDKNHQHPGNFTGMAILVGALMFASTIAVGWIRLEVMLGRSDGRRRWIWKL